MPWNSTAPIGSISVKANRTIFNQNFTYIEDTMGKTAVGSNSSSTKDHFWNVDPALDGHHRFMKGPEFTDSLGAPLDPGVSAGQGVFYFKRTSNRVQGFYRNTHGIYQAIPNYLTGTFVVTSSFQVFTAIPANTYGDIVFFRADETDEDTMQTGFCKSTAFDSDAVAYQLTNAGNGSRFASLRFKGSVGLDLQVRTEDADSGNTWNWYVTFRAYA